MPRIEVIINAAGGGFVEGETDRLIREQFVEHGLDAKVNLAKTGHEIVDAARTAAEGGAELIVAAGGDGTISAVAAEAYKAKKTLGVIPLGTLNHFSKDLAIPQETAAAVGVIAANHVKTIDLAEVNGRIFINNSSIGLYPRIVRRRELQQERLGRGKWSAAFFAALSVFRLDPLFRVRLKLDDREFVRKIPFVFVGNNEYEMDIYNIGRRVTLDAGSLSVYFLHRGGRWGVVRLVLRTLIGRLRQTKEFQVFKTSELTIEVRKKQVMVATDGEVCQMRTPLEYKILPSALTVIVPKPED